MSLFSARMSLKEAARFCQRLGTGLRAGLDVLRMLDGELKHGPTSQRRAMLRLIDRVKDGDEVGEAMSKDSFYPATLSALMVAGDESGKIDRALMLLAAHFESRVQTRKSFIRSVTPPLLQLFAGIGVISLLIYLMGILTPAGGGQMADVLGLGLRGSSGVFKLWSVVGVILILITGAIFAYTRNLGGVQNIIPLFYMVPKLGGALQTITLSKFCTAMALAFESGLDPIRSIELGLSATASEYYRSGAEPAKIAIRGGADLAQALEATHLFPQDLLMQIDMAEVSGTSAEAMNRLAADYDERAKTAVGILAGIATFLVRAGVIAFFVFMIFRIAMSYFGALDSALQGI